MSVNFKAGLILFIGGLAAVFILVGGVSAQSIDKDRALELLQTQGGPGGCTDEASCSAFCDNPDNYETCVQWAQDNGLMRSEEAEKAKRLARQARDFSGPGGCQNPEECHAFCSEPQNHDTCIDFAVQQGFLTQEEANRVKQFSRGPEQRREAGHEPEIDPGFNEDRARQIIESQGGPGGCESFEECAAFCENPDNQQACFEFAEEHGLFTDREAAQKIKRIMAEGGPGGCRGERECHQFCENPDNFEVCINFAQEHDLIPPEEVERARRGINALREGGPQGCRTQRECEQICQNPANQEACLEWAKKHGLISEEEIRLMEEFKKRREEFERRAEEFKDDFRPPEGFEPPHGEPGFTPDATPFSDFNPAEKCRENGGFWTGSTCEFPRQEEFTPPPGFTPPPEFNEPQGFEDPAARCAGAGGSWDSENQTCIFEKGESTLQQTGAYILKTFKEFFR